MGPNAASRARAVKSLPEYPSVCLKDKTSPQTRVRNVLTTGRGLNHSGKTARCTPTEVEQTRKFQDLSTRVANIIHFAGHYYLARDSISDELNGL